MGVATSEGRFIFLFRSALFVGLGSVVATIIYLTPIPDQFPQSCRRRCHELDWPMICRVKMLVEELPCRKESCPPGVLTVNRHLPGPPIQVCENDIVMVDVTNRVAGRSLSVHWRGQTLKETPHMDGVAMVTQCPILPYTTFQYKFRATEAGTHFWQFTPAGIGSEGLFGAFIVKQADTREVHRSLYDTDDGSHVIVIHAIDGRIVISSAEGHSTPGAMFNVTSGVRHRFRTIFGGHPTTCRVKLRIDHTPFLLIALDGHPIKPIRSSSVKIAYGERVDFVIEIDGNVESHELHAELEEGCDGQKGSSSTLHVITSPGNSVQPTVPDVTESLLSMQTMKDANCDEKTITCLDDVEGVYELPQELTALTLDHKIFLFFGVRLLTSGSNATIVAPSSNNLWGAPHINNRTMVLPPSPLMTQIEDIDPSLFCGVSCQDGSTCECVNVLQIPLGDTVEILLVQQGNGAHQHVFHLHGNSFFVVGASQLSKQLNAEEIMHLEEEGQLIHRNLSRPVLKDSVAVPDKGVVALRLKADNPGYWLLDQELSSGGMQVLLHVGLPSDLPDTPKNFPRCGSWVGPEFFLA